MKNLVIINSTLGAGKSTISKDLSSKMYNSHVVHGDDLSALIYNFSVYDENKINEVLKLIGTKITDLLKNRCEIVILDYVFENPTHFDTLKNNLDKEINISAIYLAADRKVIENRIMHRGRTNVDREIKRSNEIMEVQSKYIGTGDFSNIVDASREADIVVADILASLDIQK